MLVATPILRSLDEWKSGPGNLGERKMVLIDQAARRSLVVTQAIDLSYVEVLAWGDEIQNEGSNGASCPNPQEHDVQNELHTETITSEIPYALGLPLRASPAARPIFFPTAPPKSLSIVASSRET